MSDVPEIKVYANECAAMRTAAKLLDAEAATWAEGFAVRIGSELEWTAEHEWAHIRWHKLTTSAAMMRKVADRLDRKANAKPEVKP